MDNQHYFLRINASSLLTMLQNQSFDILVVDDEPTLFELLVRTARQIFPEATFISARSAQETLQYIDQQPTRFPHLVLLDIDLHQVIDGLNLLPQLYSRFKGQVPVVMLTASINERLVYEAYDRGAVAYTQKPDDLQGWKDYVAALRDYLHTTTHLRFPTLVRPVKRQYKSS